MKHDAIRRADVLQEALWQAEDRLQEVEISQKREALANHVKESKASAGLLLILLPSSRRMLT